jgi:hypothetical protein
MSIPVCTVFFFFFLLFFFFFFFFFLLLLFLFYLGSVSLVSGSTSVLWLIVQSVCT